MNKYIKMTDQEQTDLYVKPILAGIIEQLKLIDEGKTSSKWVKPFKSLSQAMTTPNKIDGGSYGLYNSMACLYFQSKYNYKYNLWGTYNQIKALGGKVIKGQKASEKGQYLFKMFDIVKKDDLNPDEVKGVFKKRKWYCVFNIDQTEGLDHLKVKPTTPPKPKSKVQEIPEIEKYIKNTNIKIISNTQGRCYYSPTEDYISMSDKASWKKVNNVSETELWYSVAFHELSHATGHKSRLDRLDNFGTAFEELIAELSSAILGAKFDIASALQPNHAQYIKGWIKQLEEKPNTLLKACALANKSVKWLDEQQQ